MTGEVAFDEAPDPFEQIELRRVRDLRPADLLPDFNPVLDLNTSERRRGVRRFETVVGAIDMITVVDARPFTRECGYPLSDAV